jgi:hypothetical protein
MTCSHVGLRRTHEPQTTHMFLGFVLDFVLFGDVLSLFRILKVGIYWKTRHAHSSQSSEGDDLLFMLICTYAHI